jgi:hypothetical protein
MAPLDSLAGAAMEDATTDCAAFAETVVFLSYFKDLKDPRQQGKITYPLDEILLLCLLAVLAGAETFVDIALFGCKKRELLRRFRPFKDGTPAHDHLGDILAVLDAEQFQRCFVAWVAALSGAPQGVIAIDGKTSRRSGRKKDAIPAIHMVSAFAARQRLVLGQVKVAEKSNEIVAIPKLLDMLAIEGAIVTIDAMGCQRDIARKVVDKQADYLLALKGNQGSLRQDIELFVADQKAAGFKDTKIGACRQAGILRGAYYDWRRDDETFRQETDAAIEAATDTLEDVARNRAIEHSDLLLIFLLRSRRPHIYNRRQTVTLAGDADNPLSVTHTGSGNVHFYMPSNGRDRPEQEDEADAPTIEGEASISVERAGSEDEDAA